MAWLVRRVEGRQEAWLYGTRGQNQHGIDVVGVAGTDAAAFQAKRLKECTEKDLEKAVRRYASGKRPFGASRFVVVTTHDANRTEIYDRLFEVRLEYTDLTIELWNRESLSTLPNSHPEIVTAFFGPAITEVFCPAPIQPPVARTELVGEQPNARRCCAARQPTWALKRNWPQPIRTAKRLPLRRPRPTDVSPSSMRMLREHDEQTTAPLAS